jgi:tetratricopeptide (TPR) repeat protein
VNNFTWLRSALHLKALIFLEKNSDVELQKTAGELKELIERGTNKKSMRYYHHLLGKIELDKANYSQAIKYFKDAVELLPYQKYWYWYYPEDHAMFLASLALAYYKSGNIENALAEYEGIISLTTGRLWQGDLVARSYYMLGKIYEEKGWKGKAIENYEKFLNLWKASDAGFPEIDDAQEKLAGLK